ncbi:dephospho-CoA kinase-domain-containing protein [Paraphysoderma sedebokerense]|nr:dephospho-CoA kinase-domain-containing protein [Paraphysoderma sedebokerense]
MRIIGLTGGIGTGKSAVSRYLQTKHVPLIDCDLLARLVVEPGHPALAKIVKTFGSEVLHQNGTLNRAQMGQIIFNDFKKRKILNNITHPWIRWEIFKRILKYWATGERLVVIDAPLLVEAGLWRFMNEVVVVFAPLETQRQRLMNRDKLSVADADTRIKSQMDMSQKLKYATKVIDNSGTLDQLHDQVDRLLENVTPSKLTTAFWVAAPPCCFAAMNAFVMYKLGLL